MRKFVSKKPHYEYLRKKWSANHRNLQTKLWEKHGEHLRQLAIGSLSGLMLLSAPHQAPIQTGGNIAFSSEEALKGFDQNVLLADSLKNSVPEEVRPLNEKEEKEITDN